MTSSYPDAESASKALSRPEDCLPSEQLPDDKLEDGAARAIAGSQDGQPMAKVQYQNSDEDHEFHGQAVNAASEKDDPQSRGDGTNNQEAEAVPTSLKEDQELDPEAKDTATNNDKQDEKPDDTKDMSPEERAKDAANKVMEYSKYIQLVETRLATIETKMGIIGAEEKKVDEAESTSKRTQAIPELRRVTWAGFKNEIKDNKKIYAVEALVGGVRYYYQRNKQQTQEIPPPSDGMERTGENSQATSGRGSVDLKDQVDRIRINSVPILMILADISDQELSLEPTVHLQPFKFLARHDKGIRSRLVLLESKWSAQAKEESLSVHNSDSGDGGKGISILDSPTDSKPDAPQVNASPEAPNTAEQRESDEEMTEKLENTRRTTSEDLMDSVEALKDLRCLVQFMDQELKDVDRFSKADPPARILFKDLWHLFKPGDLVFAPLQSTASEDRGEQQELTKVSHKKRYQVSWRILSTWGGRPNLTAGDDEERWVPKQKINPFELNCYYIDFDGEKFVPSSLIFRIKPFPGEREITSLEVYPWRYVKDYVKMRSSLKDRGEKFREFYTFKYRFCKGSTLVCQPNGWRFLENSIPSYPEQIESEVIVDFKEAIRDNPNRTPYYGFSVTNGYNDRETDDALAVSVWKDDKQEELDDKKYDFIYDDSLIDAELTVSFETKDPLLKEGPDSDFRNGKTFREEDLILLPARVLGYVFRKQHFAAFDIETLQPVVKPYSKGWKDLKLPRGHKDMLRALVKNHLSEKESSTSHAGQEHERDIVRGKGQGLIVLLHGVPGVGKTSTAECVAESYSKPLLRITCGDLGLTAKSVESELDNKFHLASTWDCVLLLDEADVFLAQRTKQDLQRNALVSVFLRVLEYYTGILFLTTNRVGAFDDAFKSRIHLPLYYPPLDQEQTMSIWKMNLKRTMERRSLMTADREEIMSYADSHFRHGNANDTAWNGRQIRNAFQTATALAEFDAQERHSKDVKNGKRDASALVHPILQPKHFQVVAHASFDFDKYLDSIDDETLAERAHRAAERNDTFPRTNIMSGRLHTGSSRSEEPPIFETGVQEQLDYENRTIARGRPGASTHWKSMQFQEPLVMSHSASDPRKSQHTLYPTAQAPRQRYMEPNIGFYPIKDTIPQEHFPEQFQRQAHISPQRAAIQKGYHLHSDSDSDSSGEGDGLDRD